LALSYWIDYLGFITEGKLAVVIITPSLVIPNWSVIYIINTAPSAHLLMLPFRLYIPLDGKNLKDGSLFLETYCKPPPSSMRDR
jgi:hypothetical protein